MLPLGFGQADFAKEGVQVPYQGVHQLLEPGIRSAVEGREHRPKQLVLDLALPIGSDSHSAVRSVVGAGIGVGVHEMGTSSAS